MSKKILRLIKMTESKKVDLFLNESGLWEGSFTNFINLNNGIMQKGTIRVKVTVDDEGVIFHETAFFDKKGKFSD